MIYRENTFLIDTTDPHRQIQTFFPADMAGKTFKLIHVDCLHG